MMVVHVLTEGFVSPNVRAFLFPLIYYKNTLKERGIIVKYFTKVKECIKDCDLLIVESKFHKKRWLNHTVEILNELNDLKNNIGKLLYFDTSDSTSLLHPEVLPIVDEYYKSQILNDKELYSKPMYGNRIFTDYVNNEFEVVDEKPSYSIPVVDKEHLDNIQIFWNSCLANYSWSGKYLMELYSKLPLNILLRYPQKKINSKCIRKNDVSCRISTAYERDTVAWFRTKAKRELEEWGVSSRLSYKKYCKELTDSKIVVSPFGWGEINYKDYEAFLSGVLLVKPDMSHLDTWPMLYKNNETYVSYKWDQSDLKKTIRNILNDYEAHRIIAENGHENYLSYLDPEKFRNVFCERFENIINK